MNLWETVFAQSRVNEGHYYDEGCLPEYRWEWPKDTWFQARLDYCRENEPVWSLKAPRKLSEAVEPPRGNSIRSGLAAA